MVCLGLIGCTGTHSITLMARDSTISGSGQAKSSGQGTGPITITIEGATYEGQWVLASGSVAGAISTIGAAGSVTWGTFIGGGGVAPGNAILRSDDGSGLRCEFQYSESNDRGVGACQDDKGRIYDMQIY